MATTRSMRLVSGAAGMTACVLAETAERKRRELADEWSQLPDDLVVPPRYLPAPRQAGREASLGAILDLKLPEHLLCLDYAEEPRGRSLVLHSSYASSRLADILWSIGRYWFVERLERVRAFRWSALVRDNLVAQDRSEWGVPRLLIEDLKPVFLVSGRRADPGYAERLLRYRLRQGLPTVVAIDDYRLDKLHLRSETVALLKQAVNVHLPPLEIRQDSSLWERNLKRRA